MNMPVNQIDFSEAVLVADAKLAKAEEKLRSAAVENDADAIQNAQEEYAEAYGEFVEEVHPELIPSDEVIKAGNAPIKQTRLSVVGINSGARLAIPAEDIIDDVQSDALQVRGVLSRLSVDQRVGIIESFNTAVMPGLKPVLSTMLTAANGKSKSAADGEIGKNDVWSSFLGAEEQRAIIQDFEKNGIKEEGFHVRDGNGKAITSFDQLSGKVNVTAYQAAENISVKSKNTYGEVRGNGITFSQPPKNYQLALAADHLIAMFAGNGTVMKVPADMQDVMSTFAKYWNAHVAQYAEANQAELGLDDEDVKILEKTLQIVTGYGFEKIATNARVVSSLETGRQVYESYIEEKGEKSIEAQRFAAELAGSNVMYVGPDLNDDELRLAAKQWLVRVVDNMGMICTKIEDGMVHQDVAEKFQAMVAEEWNSFDSSTIGKCHTDAKTHGVHTDPEALTLARAYLDDAEKIGASVIGGVISEDGLSMSPAMVFWPDELKGNHLAQRAKNLENFAPISNFMNVSDVDEAIKITKTSQCNLTSSIWTKDPAAVAKFINGTNLGSYNIFNLKHGSDNAPIGEHAGVYHHVTYTKPDGEEVELHIPVNGVTGGHSQILAQLDISGVQHAGKAVYFDGATFTGNNDESAAQLFNVKAMVEMGVDFVRDVKMTREQIEDFVAENKERFTAEQLAPSLFAA